MGRVVALNDSRAAVCFEPAEACRKCEAGALCGAAGKKHTIMVENAEHAKVGDDVYVEQAPGKALLSAFLLFGLPVIMALLGIFLGGRWGETWSVICGISGFALGLVIAKIIDDLLTRSSLLLPRIVEIVKVQGS
jgi:positive regulator of sigma E activity